VAGEEADALYYLNLNGAMRLDSRVASTSIAEQMREVALRRSALPPADS
jgi:hypothetical protein